MNKTISMFLVSVGLSLPAQSADIETLTQQSRTAVKAFGGELKTVLKASLKNASPAETISMCKLTAPAISKRVSAARNMHVARTSLKVRNSDNAPDAWEKPVLEQFEHDKANGKDVNTLEYAAITKTGGASVFRYMKAIPTGDVCLKCHGENLPQPVRAKLRSLYPNDQATGFRKGDIRGAFTVSKVLSE